MCRWGQYRAQPGIALCPALRYILRYGKYYPARTRWLEEHKAANVVSLDLNGQNAFTTALVIASAGSARHARSLADGLGELCRLRNYEFLRTEGYTAGQWILVDMNDLVVNIFQEPVRALYGLEALWGAQSAGEAPQ